MARPQVPDGGPGLQIWKVVANILNKKVRTVEKRWCCSFGGWGYNSYLKDKLLRNVTNGIKPGRTLLDRPSKLRKFDNRF
jgi:hypothetical protein